MFTNVASKVDAYVGVRRNEFEGFAVYGICDTSAFFVNERTLHLGTLKLICHLLAH